MNTLSCRSTTPPDNRRRQQEEILSGRQRETSVSFFCVSARRSGGWSLTEAGLPLCEFPVIPSALLRSPIGGVHPGRLCIRLMPGFASERELALSAGMTGNSQSSACLHEAPSPRPPVLSRARRDGSPLGLPGGACGEAAGQGHGGRLRARRHSCRVSAHPCASGFQHQTDAQTARKRVVERAREGVQME